MDSDRQQQQPDKKQLLLQQQLLLQKQLQQQQLLKQQQQQFQQRPPQQQQQLLQQEQTLQTQAQSQQQKQVLQTPPQSQQQLLQTQQQQQRRKEALLQQRILQQEHLKQQQMLLDRQRKQEQALLELLQLQDTNDEEDDLQEERLIVQQQQQQLHLQQQQRQQKEQQQQLQILQQKHLLIQQQQSQLLQQPQLVHQPQLVQQHQILQQPLQQKSRIIQQTQQQKQHDVLQPLVVQQPQVINQPQIVQTPQLQQQPQVIKQSQIVPKSQTTQQSQLIQQAQNIQPTQFVQQQHIVQQSQKQLQNQCASVSTQQQTIKQQPFTQQLLQQQLQQLLLKNKNYPQRIVVLGSQPQQQLQQRVVATNTIGQQQILPQQMQCVVVTGTGQQQPQQMQRVVVSGNSQQQPMQRVVISSSAQQQSQQLHRVVVATAGQQQQQLQQVQHMVVSGTSQHQTQQIQSVISPSSVQQQSQHLQRVVVATSSQQYQQSQQIQSTASPSSSQQQSQQVQRLVVATASQQQNQPQQMQSVVVTPGTTQQQPQHIQRVVVATAGQQHQQPQQMQRVIVNSAAGQQQQQLVQQLTPPAQHIVISQLKSPQQTQLQTSTQRSIVLGQLQQQSTTGKLQQQRVVISGQQKLIKLPQQQQLQSPQQMLLQQHLAQQLLQPLPQQHRVNTIVSTNQQNLQQQTTVVQQQQQVVQQQQQFTQQQQKPVTQQQQVTQLQQTQGLKQQLQQQQVLKQQQQQKQLQQVSQTQQFTRVVVAQDQKMLTNIKPSDQNLVHQLHVKQSHLQLQQLHIQPSQKQFQQQQLIQQKRLKEQQQQLELEQELKQQLEKQHSSSVNVGQLQRPVQSEPEQLQQKLQLQQQQRLKLQECLLKQQQQQKLQQQQKELQQQKEQQQLKELLQLKEQQQLADEQQLIEQKLLTEQQQEKQQKEFQEQLLQQKQHQQQLREQVLQQQHLKQQKQNQLKQHLLLGQQLLLENQASYVIDGDQEHNQLDEEETICLNEKLQEPLQYIAKVGKTDEQFRLGIKHHTSEEQLVSSSSSSDEDGDDDLVRKQRELLHEAESQVRKHYDALSVALGPKYREYYDDIMKNWLDGRLSRNEFDREIRKVLYVSWMFTTTNRDIRSKKDGVCVINTSTNSIITKSTNIVNSNIVNSSEDLTSKKIIGREAVTMPSTTLFAASKRFEKNNCVKTLTKNREVSNVDFDIKEAAVILSERVPLHNAFVTSLIAWMPLNSQWVERKAAQTRGVTETGFPLRLYTYVDVPQVRGSSDHWYPETPGSLARWYWPHLLPNVSLLESNNIQVLPQSSFRKSKLNGVSEAAVAAILLRPPSHMLLPLMLNRVKDTESTRTTHIRQNIKTDRNLTKRLQWQWTRDQNNIAYKVRLREIHTKLLHELRTRGRKLVGQECRLIERLRRLQARMFKRRRRVLAQFKIRQQDLRARIRKYFDRSWQEQPEDQVRRQLLKEAIATTDDDKTDEDEEDNEEEDRQQRFLKQHWDRVRLLEENRSKRRKQLKMVSLPKLTSRHQRPQSTALTIRLLRDRQRFRASHRLLQTVRQECKQINTFAGRVQDLRQKHCPCGESDDRPCQYRKQIRRLQKKIPTRKLNTTECDESPHLKRKTAKKEKIKVGKKKLLEIIDAKKMTLARKKKLMALKVKATEKKKLETKSEKNVGIAKNENTETNQKMKEKKVVKNVTYIDRIVSNTQGVNFSGDDSCAIATTKNELNKKTSNKSNTKNTASLLLTTPISTNVRETTVSKTLDINGPMMTLGKVNVGVNIGLYGNENPPSFKSGVKGDVSIRRWLPPPKDRRNAIDVAAAAARAAEAALKATHRTRLRRDKEAAAAAALATKVKVPIDSITSDDDRRASELMPPPPPPLPSHQPLTKQLSTPPRNLTTSKKPTIGARYLQQQRLLLDRHRQLERMRREEEERRKRAMDERRQQNQDLIDENEDISISQLQHRQRIRSRRSRKPLSICLDMDDDGKKELVNLSRSYNKGEEEGRQHNNYYYYFDDDDYYSSDEEVSGSSSAEPPFPPLLHDLRIHQLPRPSNRVPAAAVLPLSVRTRIQSLPPSLTNHLNFEALVDKPEPNHDRQQFQNRAQQRINSEVLGKREIIEPLHGELFKNSALITQKSTQQPFPTSTDNKILVVKETDGSETNRSVEHSIKASNVMKNAPKRQLKMKSLKRPCKQQHRIHDESVSSNLRRAKTNPSNQKLKIKTRLSGTKTNTSKFSQMQQKRDQVTKKLEDVLEERKQNRERQEKMCKKSTIYLKGKKRDIEQVIVPTAVKKKIPYKCQLQNVLSQRKQFRRNYETTIRKKEKLPSSSSLTQFKKWPEAHQVEFNQNRLMKEKVNNLERIMKNEVYKDPKFNLSSTTMVDDRRVEPYQNGDNQSLDLHIDIDQKCNLTEIRKLLAEYQELLEPLTPTHKLQQMLRLLQQLQKLASTNKGWLLENEKLQSPPFIQSLVEKEQDRTDEMRNWILQTRRKRGNVDQSIMVSGDDELCSGFAVNERELKNVIPPVVNDLRQWRDLWPAYEDKPYGDDDIDDEKRLELTRKLIDRLCSVENDQDKISPNSKHFNRFSGAKLKFVDRHLHKNNIDKLKQKPDQQLEQNKRQEHLKQIRQINQLEKQRQQFDRQKQRERQNYYERQVKLLQRRQEQLQNSNSKDIIQRQLNGRVNWTLGKFLVSPLHYYDDILPLREQLMRKTIVDRNTQQLFEIEQQQQRLISTVLIANAKKFKTSTSENKFKQDSRKRNNRGSSLWWAKIGMRRCISPLVMDIDKRSYHQNFQITTEPIANQPQLTRPQTKAFPASVVVKMQQQTKPTTFEEKKNLKKLLLPRLLQMMTKAEKNWLEQLQSKFVELDRRVDIHWKAMIDKQLQQVKLLVNNGSQKQKQEKRCEDKKQKQQSKQRMSPFALPVEKQKPQTVRLETQGKQTQNSMLINSQIQEEYTQPMFFEDHLKRQKMGTMEIVEDSQQDFCKLWKQLEAKRKEHQKLWKTKLRQLYELKCTNKMFSRELYDRLVKLYSANKIQQHPKIIVALKKLHQKPLKPLERQKLLQRIQLSKVVIPAKVLKKKSILLDKLSSKKLQYKPLQKLSEQQLMLRKPAVQQQNLKKKHQGLINPTLKNCPLRKFDEKQGSTLIPIEQKDTLPKNVRKQSRPTLISMVQKNVPMNPVEHLNMPKKSIVKQQRFLKKPEKQQCLKLNMAVNQQLDLSDNLTKEQQKSINIQKLDSKEIEQVSLNRSQQQRQNEESQEQHKLLLKQQIQLDRDKEKTLIHNDIVVNDSIMLKPQSTLVENIRHLFELRRQSLHLQFQREKLFAVINGKKVSRYHHNNIQDTSTKNIFYKLTFFLHKCRNSLKRQLGRLNHPNTLSKQQESLVSLITTKSIPDPLLHSVLLSTRLQSNLKQQNSMTDSPYITLSEHNSNKQTIASSNQNNIEQYSIEKRRLILNQRLGLMDSRLKPLMELWQLSNNFPKRWLCQQLDDIERTIHGESAEAIAGLKRRNGCRFKKQKRQNDKQLPVMTLGASSSLWSLKGLQRISEYLEWRKQRVHELVSELLDLTNREQRLLSPISTSVSIIQSPVTYSVLLKLQQPLTLKQSSLKYSALLTLLQTSTSNRLPLKYPALLKLKQPLTSKSLAVKYSCILILEQPFTEKQFSPVSIRPQQSKVSVPKTKTLVRLTPLQLSTSKTKLSILLEPQQPSLLYQNLTKSSVILKPQHVLTATEQLSVLLIPEEHSFSVTQTIKSQQPTISAISKIDTLEPRNYKQPHQRSNNKLQSQDLKSISDDYKSNDCIANVEPIFSKRPNTPSNLLYQKRLRRMQPIPQCRTNKSPISFPLYDENVSAIVHSDDEHMTLNSDFKNTPSTNMVLHVSEKSPLTIKFIKAKTVPSMVVNLSKDSINKSTEYDNHGVLKVNEIKNIGVNYRKIREEREEHTKKKTNSCEDKLLNLKENDNNRMTMSAEIDLKTAESVVHTTIVCRPTIIGIVVSRSAETTALNDSQSEIAVVNNKLIKVAVVECAPTTTVTTRNKVMKVVHEGGIPVKITFLDSMAAISKLIESVVAVTRKTPIVIVQNSHSMIKSRPARIIDNFKITKSLVQPQDNSIQTVNLKNLKKKTVDTKNKRKKIMVPVCKKTVRRHRHLIRTLTVDSLGPPIPTFIDHKFAYDTIERTVHDRFVTTIMAITAAQSIASYVPPWHPRLEKLISEQNCSDPTSIGRKNSYKLNCNKNSNVSTNTPVQVSSVIDWLENTANTYAKLGSHTEHFWNGCARTTGSTRVTAAKEIKTRISAFQAQDGSIVLESKKPTSLSSLKAKVPRTEATKSAPVVTKSVFKAVKSPIKKRSYTTATVTTAATNNGFEKQPSTSKMSSLVTFIPTSTITSSGTAVDSIVSTLSPLVVDLHKRSKLAIPSAWIAGKEQQQSASRTIKRSASMAFSSPIISNSKITATTNAVTNVSTISSMTSTTEIKPSKRCKTEVKTIPITTSTEKIITNSFTPGTVFVTVNEPLSSTTFENFKNAVPVKRSASVTMSESPFLTAQQTKRSKSMTAKSNISTKTIHSEPKTCATSTGTITHQLIRTSTPSKSKVELFYNPRPNLRTTKVALCDTDKDTSYNKEVINDSDTSSLVTTTITKEETRSVKISRTLCQTFPTPMDVTAEACSLVASTCEQFIRSMVIERLMKAGRGAGTLELRRRDAYTAAMATDENIRPTPEYCKTTMMINKRANNTNTLPLSVQPTLSTAMDIRQSEPELEQKPPFTQVIVNGATKKLSVLTVETAVETQTKTTTTNTISSINKTPCPMTITVSTMEMKSSPMVIDGDVGTSARTRGMVMKKEKISSKESKTTLLIPQKILSRSTPIPLASKSQTLTNEKHFKNIPTILSNRHQLQIVRSPFNANVMKVKSPSTSTATVEVTKTLPILTPEQPISMDHTVNNLKEDRGFFVQRGRPLFRPEFHRRRPFGTLTATCSMAAAEETVKNNAIHSYFDDRYEEIQINDGAQKKCDGSWDFYYGDHSWLPPVSRLNGFLEVGCDSTCSPESKNNNGNHQIIFKTWNKTDLDQRRKQQCSHKIEREPSIYIEEKEEVERQQQSLILEINLQQQHRKRLEREMESRIREYQNRPADSPEAHYQKFFELQHGSSKKPSISPKYRAHSLNTSRQGIVSWN